MGGGNAQRAGSVARLYSRHDASMRTSNPAFQEAACVSFSFPHLPMALAGCAVAVGRSLSENKQRYASDAV
jgi:hypothetical protein